MLENLKAQATRPIGPLPLFGWVVVVLGGYVGYKFLSGRSGGGGTSTTATGSTGSVGASSTDVNALTSQISELGNQLNTLTGKISSTVTTTKPGAPTTETITNQSPNQSISGVAKAFGVSTTVILKLNPSFSLNTPLSVGQKVILPIGAVYTPVKAAVTKTAAVSSTAIKSLPKPAAAPQTSSNTAVTTPVHSVVATPTATTKTITAVASKAPTMPTVQTTHISSSTLSIPAMTPIKKVVPNTVTPPHVIMPSTKGSNLSSVKAV